MVIILVPDYTRSLEEEQEGQQQRGKGVNEIVGVVFFVSESRGARGGFRGHWVAVEQLTG